MSDWYHAQHSARNRYDGISQRANEKHERILRARRSRSGLSARIRAIPSLASLDTGPMRTVRTYWWVPAGIAVFFMLRVIIG